MLEDQSQGCVLKAVTVCDHCLLSRGGGGGRDELMPWGSRTSSWRLNCVLLLLLVPCKMPALALHFDEVIKELKPELTKGNITQL